MSWNPRECLRNTDAFRGITLCEAMLSLVLREGKVCGASR